MRNLKKEVEEMRKGEIWNLKPYEQVIYKKALTLARLGWGHFNDAKELREKWPEAAEWHCYKAEEFLTEALQLLTHYNLKDTKLYKRIEESLEELSSKWATV